MSMKLIDEIINRFEEIRPHLAKMKTSEAQKKRLDEQAWRKHVELLEKNWSWEDRKRVPSREQIRRDLGVVIGWIDAAAILKVLNTIKEGQIHQAGNLLFEKTPSGEIISYEGELPIA